MIPPVRTWIVRVIATETDPEERIVVETCTKFLAKLVFRQDFPRYWGREIRISLARKAKAC